MASSSPPSNTHPFSGLEDVVEEDAVEAAAGENGRLMPVEELKPMIAKPKETFNYR